MNSLSAEEMAVRIVADRATDTSSPPQQSKGLDEVFCLVKAREGIDLRAYRQSTVERRVTSRLQRLRCQDYEQYATFLASNPAESQLLIEHVTIKVSRFFRDAPVFARLSHDVLPDLVQRHSAGGLQIWSAGCGNGEEAYSLAILLAEMARQGMATGRVAMWGTDVDSGALALAGQGIYSESALAEIPPSLVEAYFTPRQGRFGPLYEVQARLRDWVRFLRHDLLSAAAIPDAPLFDLVLCRNVLIYFERPAQEQALCLLTSSIAQGGYLCLGEAEHLTKEHQADFQIVDRQARLYRKV